MVIVNIFKIHNAKGMTLALGGVGLRRGFSTKFWWAGNETVRGVSQGRGSGAVSVW